MTQSNVKVDSLAVKELAQILTETDLTEIEYETEHTRIRVARQITQAVNSLLSSSLPPSPPSSPNFVESLPQDWLKHPGVITSPMVGTVYLAPSPGAEPFVKVDSIVEVGQTLMIVEAMKVMNPIKATKAGRVMQILVEDTSPIEYGEPLIIVA